MMSSARRPRPAAPGVAGLRLVGLLVLVLVLGIGAGTPLERRSPPRAGISRIDLRSSRTTAPRCPLATWYSDDATCLHQAWPRPVFMPGGVAGLGNGLLSRTAWGVAVQG
jgi:hypothetical protein